MLVCRNCGLRYNSKNVASCPKCANPNWRNFQGEIDENPNLFSLAKRTASKFLIPLFSLGIVILVGSLIGLIQHRMWDIEVPPEDRPALLEAYKTSSGKARVEVFHKLARFSEFHRELLFGLFRRGDIELATAFITCHGDFHEAGMQWAKTHGYEVFCHRRRQQGLGDWKRPCLWYSLKKKQ